MNCPIHSSKPYVLHSPHLFPTLHPRHTSILLLRNLPVWLSGDDMSQLCWSSMDTVTVSNQSSRAAAGINSMSCPSPNPGAHFHENPYQAMTVILKPSISVWRQQPQCWNILNEREERNSLTAQSQQLVPTLPNLLLEVFAHR